MVDKSLGNSSVATRSMRSYDIKIGVVQQKNRYLHFSPSLRPSLLVCESLPLVASTLGTWVVEECGDGTWEVAGGRFVAAGDEWSIKWSASRRGIIDFLATAKPCSPEMQPSNRDRRVNALPGPECQNDRLTRPSSILCPMHLRPLPQSNETLPEKKGPRGEGTG